MTVLLNSPSPHCAITQCQEGCPALGFCPEESNVTEFGKKPNDTGITRSAARPSHCEDRVQEDPCKRAILLIGPILEQWLQRHPEAGSDKSRVGIA